MINIIPVSMRRILPGDNFIDILIDSLHDKLLSYDILVVSSKPILISKNIFRDLENITSSNKAIEYGVRYNLDPRFVQLIFNYANGVYGGTKKFLLASLNDVLLPNAGIDRKNVPQGKYSIPKIDFRAVAKQIYFEISRKLNIKVGVIISDSTIAPLRMGTRGVALAVFGFNPLRNYVNDEDLFGNIIMVTTLSLADCIASAALLVMGEGKESIPAAIVRGLDVEFKEKDFTESIKIDITNCIYGEVLSKCKYVPK